MKDSEALPTSLPQRAHNRVRPILMHPLVFISTWILLGSLFALQEWLNLRRWGYHISLVIELESWGMEFLIWGILTWSLWRWLGSFIQTASLGAVLSRILPLSMAACLAKEMIWVFFFPNLPLNRPHMPYWTRFLFHVNADALDDMVMFWCSFSSFEDWAITKGRGKASTLPRNLRHNSPTHVSLRFECS